MPRITPIISGGMDSGIMLDLLLADPEIEVTSAVSFNYGQRHQKELNYARAHTAARHVKHHVIDLWSSGLTAALEPSGSSLVTSTDVPEGHYAQESMKATVVPNRNMMMISIAGAIAVAEGSNFVATGVHAGDHFIYPDCRPEFIQAAGAALDFGNDGFGEMKGIYAPFLHSTKADIADLGIKVGFQFSGSWSCYKGGDNHCGKCGTCVERLEAIDEAAKRHDLVGSEIDATIYEDTSFWKRAIKEGAK